MACCLAGQRMPQLTGEVLTRSYLPRYSLACDKRAGAFGEKQLRQARRLHLRRWRSYFLTLLRPPRLRLYCRHGACRSGRESGHAQRRHGPSCYVSRCVCVWGCMGCASHSVAATHFSHVFSGNYLLNGTTPLPLTSRPCFFVPAQALLKSPEWCAEGTRLSTVRSKVAHFAAPCHSEEVLCTPTS